MSKETRRTKTNQALESGLPSCILPNETEVSCRHRERAVREVKRF